MRKEFIKLTRQIFNENMEATSNVEEVIITSLIADVGKKIRCKVDGILCTGVDIGTEDSEENYEEVDDPKYTEVIAAIENEVANGL